MIQRDKQKTKHCKICLFINSFLWFCMFNQFSKIGCYLRDTLYIIFHKNLDPSFWMSMLYFMNQPRLDHLAMPVSQTTTTQFFHKSYKDLLCQLVLTFKYWDSKISYQKFIHMLLSCWLFTLVVSSVFINMTRKQLYKDFEV